MLNHPPPFVGERKGADRTNQTREEIEARQDADAERKVLMRAAGPCYESFENNKSLSG